LKLYKKKKQGKNEEKKTRTKFENKNSRLKGAIKKQKKKLIKEPMIKINKSKE
jgi:hypothetical protein